MLPFENYLHKNIKFSHIHQIGIWAKFLTISSLLCVNKFQTVTDIVVIVF
jgi:hypothetical protein